MALKLKKYPKKPKANASLATMERYLERRKEVDKANAKIKAEQVENERKIALMKLENAKIEQQTNLVKSQGLTREILQERYIDAIRNSSNRIIITDGKTPILINQ
jgi:hypothetical protein